MTEHQPTSSSSENPVIRFGESVTLEKRTIPLTTEQVARMSGQAIHDIAARSGVEEGVLIEAVDAAKREVEAKGQS